LENISEVPAPTEREYDILRAVHKSLDDKFGTDIKILDIRGLTVMADYFIIASGGNPNQIRAMADEVGKNLTLLGVRQLGSEGYGSASWILLDFGDFIVHIFDRESRGFYNLERIWSDAVLVNV
jgi:ribosome-associated protein